MTRAASPATLSVIDRILLVVSSMIIAAAGVMAALSAAGYATLPARSFCWSQVLLGRECPGCGLSRSFIATALGDPARAFELNPTGPFLFAVLVVILVTRVARWRGLPWPRAADATLAIVTVVILLTRTAWFYLRG